MSTYILMKILESSPRRYDKGIHLLTLGRIDKACDRLVSKIKQGDRVLDLGCGTGALTLRAARKGASVKGIDVNAQMLEIAEKQAKKNHLAEKIELSEMGVAELGSEEPESYDAVMAGLCLSELSSDELNFTLTEAKRVLKPGGLLLVADEVKPKSVVKKILNGLLRAPLVMLTYLMTQTTTHAISDLPEKIRKFGFQIESIKLDNMESFMELVARK